MAGAAAFTAAARLGLGSKSTPLQPLEVVVVGAGAFGGWTALHLLRHGARVTLVDAWGAGNSRASSGGDTRVIRAIYGPDRIYHRMVARSFEIWKDSQQRWQRPLYHRTGALWMFAGDDSYARASLPHAREAGFEVQELSPAQASQRFSQIDFRGIDKAYFEPEAGYLLARRACQAVLERIEARGGRFVQAKAGVGEIRSGRLAEVRLEGGGSLQADAFVFACGPWLGRLFPDLLGQAVRPTRQAVFYFGTPPGNLLFSEQRMPVWVEFGERVLYGIPSAEGRGFKWADDSRGPEFDPDQVERLVRPEEVRTARRHLSRRFPAMARAPLLESRVCQYENSPDGHFILDRHPEAENLWLAGGGSGHGFKLGPAVGERLARCILGQAEPDPFFSLKRLKGLKGPSHSQIEKKR